MVNEQLKSMGNQQYNGQCDSGQIQVFGSILVWVMDLSYDRADTI